MQTTLTKVFVSWRKIRRADAAHAYAARTLVNTYLTDKRLKRTGDLLPTGCRSARSSRLRRRPG